MTQKTVNRLTIAVAIAMFFTAIFVLETMVVALVPSTSKAALLGSLIAYRLIYFVLPLALAILLVAIYEMRRSARGSNWPRRLLSVLTGNAKRDPGHRPR